MIGIPEVGSLQNALISGKIGEGLTATTLDGEPAYFQLVDKFGRVLESGPSVSKEAWNVTLNVYKNFLIGEGHLKIHTKPPGIVWDPKPDQPPPK